MIRIERNFSHFTAALILFSTFFLLENCNCLHIRLAVSLCFIFFILSVRCIHPLSSFGNNFNFGRISYAAQPDQFTKHTQTANSVYNSRPSSTDTHTHTHSIIFVSFFLTLSTFLNKLKYVWHFIYCLLRSVSSMWIHAKLPLEYVCYVHYSCIPDLCSHSIG